MPTTPRDMKCDMDRAARGPPADSIARRPKGPRRKRFPHRVVTRPFIKFVVQTIVGLPLCEITGRWSAGGSAMIAKWLGLATALTVIIAGSVLPANSQEYPFVYSNGTYTNIDVPGSIETGAEEINNSGEVVGSYYEGSSYSGFIYSNGVYTTLDFPGSTNTYLSGINNSGEIVGSYHTGSGSEAFTYSNGVFTALDLPAGPSGINDSGQIIGGQYPPYLYSDGVSTTLVPPGQINYITAVAINNSGEVIGNYSVSFPVLVLDTVILAERTKR
jgi:probable HAF family extracellular repeat protein